MTLEKKYSPHTIFAYKRDLESFSSFCKEESKTFKLEKGNYPEIRSWIVSLVNSGVSNKTINRKIVSLNNFYKFLQRSNQIKKNPLTNHKSLKTSNKIQVPFSEKEMNSVLESFKEGDFISLRDKLIIELLYSTGIRREELVSLKENSVNLYNDTIKILGKGNKERYLPLLKSVKSTFLCYLKAKRKLYGDQEYIFVTNRGNKIYGTFVYRIVNLYFSNVSTKVKKSPHIIRHSFATHLLNEGADFNSVKELLGHSSLASTQIYTHTSLEHLKKVYKKSHPRNKKQ